MADFWALVWSRRDAVGGPVISERLTTGSAPRLLQLTPMISLVDDGIKVPRSGTEFTGPFCLRGVKSQNVNPKLNEPTLVRYLGFALMVKVTRSVLGDYRANLSHDP